MRTPILTLSLLLLFSTTAQPQSIVVTGQVRARSEVDARSFVPGVKPDVQHLLRSRLGVKASLDSHAHATIELQDARVFGAQRRLTNAGAAALDVRQAMIEVKSIAGLLIDARVGRQVIAYANERLLGAADWGNFGQTFDGLVVKAGAEDFNVDVLALSIARNANIPVYSRDVFLTGAWGTWRPEGGKASVQAFYLFDNPRVDSLQQYRHTTGAYANARFDAIDVELEGAAQLGDYTASGRSIPIRAMMMGGRAGYTFDAPSAPRIGLGFDYLSGSNPALPDVYGAFNPLYPTNHKFYGLIDHINDVVAQTRGRGLSDMMVSLSATPFTNFKATLDVHQFDVLHDTTSVPDVATPINGVGNELDITLVYKASKAFGVQAGYSVFDGYRERSVLVGRKTIQWGFVMLTYTMQ